MFLNLDFVRLFARKIYFFIVCFIAGNYKQTGGRASASANFANSGRNFQNWAFNLTFLNARSTYTRNIFQINSDQSTSQPLLTTMISSFLAFRLNYLFYNIQLHIIILWFWKAFLTGSVDWAGLFLPWLFITSSFFLCKAILPIKFLTARFLPTRRWLLLLERVADP